MGWKLPFCDRINTQDQGGHNLAMKEEGNTCAVRRHEGAIKVTQLVNAVVMHLELSYSNNQVLYVTSAAVLHY